MKDTKISWAHHTVNFWWGCERVSPACTNCYAETIAKLFSRGKATWGKSGLRWIRTERAVSELIKISESAKTRERVFINSMSDTFENRRGLDAPRLSLFKIARRLENIDFLLLTKRPQNIRRMVPKEWLHDWPANVVPMTTVYGRLKESGFKALLPEKC